MRLAREDRAYRSGNMGKLLSALLTCSLMVSAYALVLPCAEAGSGITLSGGYSAMPPTIDGNIQAGEWVAASTNTFGPFGPISGTLYMMNDGLNLYIAVSIEGDDDFDPGDGFEVYFDNDHGAEANMEEGDDYVRASGESGFVDGYYYFVNETAWGTAWDTGTVDGLAMGSRQGTSNQFELRHPLDSTDDVHDFSLTAGQTVGFSLWIGVDNGWWCSLTGVCPPYYSPSTFANYIVASKPAPTIYGLDPILILVTALVALSIILSIVLMRRRKRPVQIASG